VDAGTVTGIFYKTQTGFRPFLDKTQLGTEFKIPYHFTQQLPALCQSVETVMGCKVVLFLFDGQALVTGPVLVHIQAKPLFKPFQAGIVGRPEAADFHAFQEKRHEFGSAFLPGH
jgi:hypothetical protein